MMFLFLRMFISVLFTALLSCQSVTPGSSTESPVDPSPIQSEAAAPAKKSVEQGWLPEEYWDEATRNTIKKQIMPYLHRLAPGATHDNKFDEQYAGFYQSAGETYRWRYIKPDERGGWYWMIDRPAASFDQSRTAIAGHLKFREKDFFIEDYDEAFWMFKMPEDELQVKSLYLFNLYTRGEALEPFYRMNRGTDYIEFPDNQVYYNKKARKWEPIVH
jgi:hypothetical protein